MKKVDFLDYFAGADPRKTVTITDSGIEINKELKNKLEKEAEEALRSQD
jgi:hypothetical protein